VIIDEEIAELEAYGVAKIYSPEDGRHMGLRGMIEHLLEESDYETPRLPLRNGELEGADLRRLASALTQIEGVAASDLPEPATPVPVLGLTGPGGAGKSVMTDELVRRFLLEYPDRRAAILSVDPSRKRTGGALLGDRIRMNAIDPARVFMRSFATRGSGSELSGAISGAISVCKAAGYDLVVVETSGIGQGDIAITEVCDVSVYVMTPEYGAASQLEKIDMLDFADLVAVNKSDRRGADDALRDVRKQFRRNREISHDVSDDRLPVFGTIASRFNDSGVNRLFTRLLGLFDERLDLRLLADRAAPLEQGYHDVVIVPPDREHYLGEIAQCSRAYRQRIEREALLASRLYRLEGARRELGDDAPVELRSAIEQARRELGPEALERLAGWEELQERYAADELVTHVRGKELRQPLTGLSLAGSRIRKVCPPRYADWGDRLRWLRIENVPGEYPYTAGAFHLRRMDEDPKRQFAGEGPPQRTNRRFHYLCKGQKAQRLSVAFDSAPSRTWGGSFLASTSATATRASR
jgi:methylmalonyl-CoA mutase